MNEAKGGRRVIIVVQQESLRERPRIHKLSRILTQCGVPVQVWKFGDPPVEEFEGLPIRNIMRAHWRQGSAALRYLVWMATVFARCWSVRNSAHFVAVGFDSAFPLALMPVRRPQLIFDNIDNISMSYRWPAGIRGILRSLEGWIAHRAWFHVIPSRSRWNRDDANLRVIRNTPSREAVEAARGMAARRNYRPGHPFTIYLNGWLSSTRGIDTLMRTIDLLGKRHVEVRVLVAGRLACDDASRLVAMDRVEHLGMLTNDEALATYYRSDLAFAYYDPAYEINRRAESQKWTDCWATDTPFVTNVEVTTLREYLERDACFALPYDDADGLARLIEELVQDRSRLEAVRNNLKAMRFDYWDAAMKNVMTEWLAPGEAGS